ncbi:MAG: hypothetical protein NC204_07000 [Candidatus Amulumruptor caecigallinarius]|nr:hypothetical protein [Candidatus Amulumruptor caecigallinarius]
MNIFKHISFAFAGICALTAGAQTCEIPMTVAPPYEGDVVSPKVEQRLESKLKSIVSRAGIVGAPGSQFFISGRFDTGYAELTSGPTPAHYVNTTLSFFIGDAESHKIFSTLTLDLKGVGSTEEQAYNKAISSINFNNPEFRQFVEAGKKKILEYYNSNYPKILAKAKTAASQRNYEEAMYYATQIPECCAGFGQAQQVISSAYTARTAYEGDQLLSKAQAEWAADPTDEGARRAYEYINQIDPASPAATKAKQLGELMRKTVKSNWDFENVQKYKDELALKKQRMNNAASIEKARIESARAIGVAWAKAHSNRTVVYNYHRWY